MLVPFFSRRRSMSPYAEEFLPITKRLRSAIRKLVDEEWDRASQAGVPSAVFFDGIVNTLLNTTIRIVCDRMFPQEDPHGTAREERVRRMQRALSDAVQVIMRHELGEPKRVDLPSWVRRQGGNA
jgi:hypothetical protein